MTDAKIQEIMALVNECLWPVAGLPNAIRLRKAIEAALREAFAERNLRESVSDKTQQVPEHCAICGSDEPFSGTCGGGRLNPSALCYQRVHGKSSVVPQPAQVSDKSSKAEQPQTKNAPMTEDQIKVGLTLAGWYHEELDPFRAGVRLAEHYYGITKD